MTTMLRPAAVAALLNVSKGSLYAMLRSGAIPSIQVGPRSVRIPKAALEHWIAQNTRAGGDPAEAAR